MKKFLLVAVTIGGIVFYILYLGNKRGIKKSSGLLPGKVAGSKRNAVLSKHSPVPSPAFSVQTSGYKDGVYTGNTADAFYGNVQVRVDISKGRINSVQFLQYPTDHETSVMINNQAMPYLTSEAVQSQSANVDIVSGATLTSQAFIQSLQSALSQAKG